MKREHHVRHKEGGFGLVEVVIAILILSIGLVSLSGLFGAAISSMYLSQESLIAKQLARETLESIFTARNTHQITFDQIMNVGAGGIFQDGFQSVTVAGDDGLVGTADDGAIAEMVLPGPDGYMGTGDDEIRSLANFQRQILIQPVIRPDLTVDANLRQVTTFVRYANVRGQPITYQVDSLVSRFR
jgi:type II secretory pathway pseudopilin PulG